MEKLVYLQGPLNITRKMTTMESTRLEEKLNIHKNIDRKKVLLLVSDDMIASNQNTTKPNFTEGKH